MLLQMDLDTYIPPSGYVGIWITNASTVRNLVLGAGGLFEAWNLTLVEEWVWVKTTRHGEPVTSIRGSWRKPYEVFLIGKAPAHRLVHAAKLKEEDIVKRVLFGCPDLHSRKPCLKILIEGLRMVKKSGRVLEIFARHLVAGWWSWGDEVLKFNWEKYWTDGASNEDDGDRIEDNGANRSGAGCSRSDSSESDSAWTVVPGTANSETEGSETDGHKESEAKMKDSKLEDKEWEDEEPDWELLGLPRTFASR